jgi:hypothetical protein
MAFRQKAPNVKHTLTQQRNKMARLPPTILAQQRPQLAKLIDLEQSTASNVFPVPFSKECNGIGFF